MLQLRAYFDWQKSAGGLPGMRTSAKLLPDKSRKLLNSFQRKAFDDTEAFLFLYSRIFVERSIYFFFPLQMYFAFRIISPSRLTDRFDKLPACQEKVGQIKKYYYFKGLYGVEKWLLIAHREEAL